MLVTGAGPIGLLAAMMGRQRGLDVHVLDRATDGPKPELVAALGATYHTGPVKKLAQAADVVIECTGAARWSSRSCRPRRRGAITCLTGISSGGRPVTVDVAAINKTMVLENDVIVGSVNANRRHYESAAAALAQADPAWLARLVNRRVPLADWNDALVRRADDVKPVIELAGA